MVRAQFMAAIAKYPGVTLDTEAERDNGELILDSPAGKVFSANGAHCLVEAFRNQGGQSWKSEAYDYIVERLSLGLEDCTIEDCDHCEEMRGDDND